MCRPQAHQELCYNGHKRVHGLKFQGIAIPNGLIGYLWGPVLARRHDAFMLHESGLIEQLDALCTSLGSVVCVFGDPAYPLLPTIQCPFKGANLTQDQCLFNSVMSCSRVCVEWSFGFVLANWSWLDFKRNLKLFLSPIGLFYGVGVLLANCICCVRGGNETSQLFGVLPPTLEEYLAM
jgi:hypothetical protein